MLAGGPREAARKKPSVRASARASALASVHGSLAGVLRTAAMPSAIVARRTVPGNRVDSRADDRRTAATESVNVADRQIGPESLGEDLLLAAMPSAIEAERTAATGMTGRGPVATEGGAEAGRWDEAAKVEARAFRTFASSMLLTSAAKVTDVKRDTPTTASAGCFEIGWKTPRASSARTALARTASLSILRATGSLAAVATATVTATKKSEAEAAARRREATMQVQRGLLCGSPEI
mmetsp:Transcript_77069/g.184630  ORF Transcript_77069/g.184630 Transcript_77069/m.184630 type:complete len:237 (+) Transcript_77069:747-1457(+)